MIGGSKYKIIVTYFHSVHDTYTEEENTFIRLKWATEEWEEQIIPKKFLFTRNSFAPLKITGFSPDMAIVRNLFENDLAFKNSRSYLIQDIPDDYLGSPTLKFNTRVKTNKISLQINAPVIVYVAYLAHYANSLPEEFEDTQQSLNLVEIEERINPEQKRILAKRSGMMKIMKKTFPEGKINIPLKSTGFNVKGTPLLMWFMYDMNAGGPVTCGGDEINVSNSNGPYFKSCKASSENRDSSCKFAFNEKMRDAVSQMWHSRGEGIGAWIEVNLKGLFIITKLIYRDKKISLGRNSQLELSFR